MLHPNMHSTQYSTPTKNILALLVHPHSRSHRHHRPLGPLDTSLAFPIASLVITQCHHGVTKRLGKF
jgi:hypothetical protein